MFNLTTESITAQRNTRVSGLLELLVAQTATDLHAGTVNRDVAVPALTKIVTAVLPNTGAGHADMVRSQVNDAVDAALGNLVDAAAKEEAKTKEKAA